MINAIRTNNGKILGAVSAALVMSFQCTVMAQFGGGGSGGFWGHVDVPEIGFPGSDPLSGDIGNKTPDRIFKISRIDSFRTAGNGGSGGGSLGSFGGVGSGGGTVSRPIESVLKGTPLTNGGPSLIGGTIPIVSSSGTSGVTGPGLSAIPTPGSGVLLIVGGALFTGRRRRRSI